MSAPLTDRARRLAGVGRQFASSVALTRRSDFVTSAPSAQNAIDAVPDSWASKFPGQLGELHAGKSLLFEDSRIRWGFERLGGVEGKAVLDLGPLEGAHSYMAQESGASRILGVEANRMAFLKCLVTKELLELSRCAFVCGEINEYLEASAEPFDVCIASGILYHMTDPVRLIDLISQRASRMIMWTHVYSDEALENKQLAQRLSGPHDQTYEGFTYRVHRHSYGLDSHLRGFFGGTSSHSNWMPREELMRALEHFGWRNVEVAFDEPLHPNGPSLALVAERADDPRKS